MVAVADADDRFNVKLRPTEVNVKMALICARNVVSLSASQNELKLATLSVLKVKVDKTATNFNILNL